MQKQIDTIVCSDVLNYVDYQKVITSLKAYMKPGARLILAEMPGRGYKQLHSGAGLDSAFTLESFLERSGFEIEIRRENWPSLLIAKLI